MKTKPKTLAAAAALIAGIISAPAAYAHGTSKSPGSMMDQGGMMGQGGMMQGGRGGMMGHGMMGGMMQGGRGGMMGHGMMGGMMQGGQGGMMGHGFGDRVVPSTHLSTDDVRHFLEHRLARRGNKRLKVGEVKEEGEDSIVADIVTVDDSLVERLKVDRHTGKIEHVD